MTKFKVLLAAFLMIASQAESEGAMKNIEKKEKAKWKRSGISGYIYCSACYFIPKFGEQSKICPNCKAEMESEDDYAQIR